MDRKRLTGRQEGSRAPRPSFVEGRYRALAADRSPAGKLALARFDAEVARSMADHERRALEEERDTWRARALAAEEKAAALETRLSEVLAEHARENHLRGILWQPAECTQLSLFPPLPPAKTPVRARRLPGRPARPRKPARAA
jgi:hypothetical protein